MKRALIVATVGGFLTQFEVENIRILKELDYEIHYASNFQLTTYFIDEEVFEKYSITKHQVDFVRTPFSLKNISAYKQLKEVINSNTYNLIHCHTPMGSVLTRLAAKSNKNTKVIYTAHGFHFYKGAPFINWMLFYPVERYLSKYTDILITINQDDYVAAKKFTRKADVRYINGVGIDILDTHGNETSQKRRDNIRSSLGIKENDIMILSVGELNKNKNQRVVIEALSALKKMNVYFVMCGIGNQKQNLIGLSDKENVSKWIKFAGYQNNINDWFKAADIFVLPSKREGKSVSLMKAMTAGLPAVVSDIRGNKELIIEGKGGYRIRDNRVSDYAKALYDLIDSKELRIRYGSYNQEYIKQCSKDVIRNDMMKIYKSIQ